MIKKIIPLLVYVFILCSCQKQKEIEYYDNGSIKYEVPLNNGFKEGEMKEFLYNGKVHSISNWKKGVMNGAVIHYYRNGQIESKSKYVNGKIVDTAFFFRQDGSLQEKHFYENGKLIDFYKYKKTGGLDLKYRHPIFISNSDTINLGDNYLSKIRLGNRYYHKIQVNLLDLSNYTGNEERIDLKYFNDKISRLKNADSLTAILNLKPEQKGKITIQGIIYDIYEKGDTTTFHSIPFKHYIFVK